MVGGLSFLPSPSHASFGFLGNTDKANGTSSSGDGVGVANGGRRNEESRVQDKANHARAVCHCLVEE